MEKPEVDKSYIFVRVRGIAIEHAEFTRSDDGSALILSNGVASIFECESNAWLNALAELSNSGFVELGDAKTSGRVPQDWTPPSVVTVPVVASK